MIKLTPHEQKILNLVKENPEIIRDPEIRKTVAEKHGLTEKTLRNRIGDLKKYGVLSPVEKDKYGKSNINSPFFIEEKVRLVDREDSKPIWQFFKTIFQHRKGIFFINLGILITTIIVLLMIPNWYRSTTTFVINKKDNTILNDMVSNASLMNMVPNLGNQTSYYIALLNSRRILDLIIDEFELKNVYDLKYRDDVYKTLLENCQFIDNENGTISINCLYKEDPIKAAKMSNQFYNHLYNLAFDLEKNNAISYRKYIESNQAIALDSLKQLEIAFKDFQSETELYSVDDQVRVSVENLATMELEKIKMEIEYDYLSNMYDKPRPDITSIGVKLETLKDKITKMKNDDQYVQLPIAEIPDKSMLYLRYYRNIMIQEKITDFLTLKLEHAKLDERKTTANIFLLDQAAPMEKKAWPPRTVYLVITMFFSSTLSIGYFRIKDLINMKSKEIKNFFSSS